MFYVGLFFVLLLLIFWVGVLLQLLENHLNCLQEQGNESDRSVRIPIRLIVVTHFRGGQKEMAIRSEIYSKREREGGKDQEDAYMHM